MAINKGETNVITTQDNDHVLSIDFIERFNGNVATILGVLGSANVIPMANGSTIKVYATSITEPEDTREEGGIIPLTKVSTELLKTETLDIQFRRKATTFEEIQKVGRENAITKTDEKLLRAEQKRIRTGLVASLADGTASLTAYSLQQALGQAWGKVAAAFDDDDVDVVGFVNPEDIGDYLGNATITIQTVFGMQYIVDFLGYSVIFVTAAVDKGTVYATAAQNLNFYYVDVNGDAGQALGYTTDETGYVGVKHYVGDERATAETGLVLGIKFIIERADGVVIATIDDGSGDGGSETGETGQTA